ncbi:MAG: AIPR family protein [Paludibacteraceae bacterium]|nr:AIPR family protein [Paludibacteraceae bacterium]
MSELIKGQVQLAREEIKTITGKTISEERAFSHVLLKYLFNVDYADQIGSVTDGANDGGIDFLYYDEEESKVILCQSKYTGTLSFDQIISELNKMYSTVQNFKKANTGIYNEALRLSLQNAKDRLPEGYEDNYEYYVFTTAPVDINAAMKKIENTSHEFPTDTVSIYTEDEIEKAIQRSLESLATVEYEKIQLDRSNNILRYESKDSEGIMCNVLSTSIISLYNKYAGAGLFDLNIRRYIKNTLVDTGIKKTLDGDRENFWFLNNGIIIACEDYEVDGNTVKLSNFSIVNGGQTTTLIGNYKGTNTREFYIPCKIVATKDNARAADFFTKIAEATNSQKPIYARDLKSNAPEMVQLYNWLKTEKIYLEIKRGFKPAFKPNHQIKNDELGQLILSFAFQKPGTARSGKKVIFENQGTYDQLFKVNYAKDPAKKAFLLDIIRLNERYNQVEKELKGSDLTPTQLEILRNGRQTIFAVMGMCYRLANGDTTEKDILENPKTLGTIALFNYGPILSNYKADDIDQKFERVVRDIVAILAEAYQQAYEKESTTSVSNFMKTDIKYYSEIATKVVSSFRFFDGKDLKENFDLFKR